jgi:hypothetical protein
MKATNTIVTTSMTPTQLLRHDATKKQPSPRRRSASQIFTYRLIGWLITAKRKKNKSYQRAAQLIHDIQRMTRILDTENICVDWDEHRGLNMPKRGYSFREWKMLFARISAELQRHRVFPRLDRLFDDGTWNAEWRSNTRTDWMRSSQADLREQPVTLTDAVIEIVRAATDGYILLLRECRNCGRWFAAGLKTQVFCSPECQKKYYWSGATWKAHRRAYMRRYRKIKSLPNVK